MKINSLFEEDVNLGSNLNLSFYVNLGSGPFLSFLFFFERREIFLNLRSLKIVELKDDENFIAKDEANDEFVVFKGQEIKSFKNLLEAKDYLKGR